MALSQRDALSNGDEVGGVPINSPKYEAKALYSHPDSQLSYQNIMANPNLKQLDVVK